MPRPLRISKSQIRRMKPNPDESEWLEPGIPQELIRTDAATCFASGRSCGACGVESHELIWDITGADPTRYCPGCWPKRSR